MIEQAREYAFAGGYPVGAARWDHEGEENVPPHTHAYIELALVLEGTATHVTHHHRRSIGVGDVIAVPPSSWHCYVQARGFRVFNVFVGQELIQRDLVWIFDHPMLALLLLHGGETAAPLAGDSQLALQGWLDQIAAARCRTDPGAGILKRSLIGCVLAELTAASFLAEPEVAVLSLPVRTVLAAMFADPAHPWTLGELAALGAVSPSHLRRQFSHQLGTSPMTWLTRSRAEMAAGLLVTTDDSVAEIGRIVGWTDPNYASRRFRQIYGRTPTEYRSRFTTSSAQR